MSEDEFIVDDAPVTHSCVKHPEGTEAVLGSREMCVYCSPPDRKPTYIGAPSGVTFPTVPGKYDALPAGDAPQYEVLETDGSTEVYDPATPGKITVDATTQARMERAARRMLAAMKRQNTRSATLERTRQGKIKGRRKKNKLAKASRKRNR
jgi:hypothetical protein